MFARVAALITIVAVAACAADPNASVDDPSDADDATRSVEEVLDPVASGVGVRAAGCGLTEATGTGVAVAEPGIVATAAHTVAGADSITVIDASGGEHPARVIAFDPAADLAALAVPSLAAPPLPIGTARTGDASTLRWRPDDGVTRIDAAITQRLLITIEDIYVDQEVQRTGVELSAEIVIGDSGGPVLDDRDMVVGIVYATSKSRPRIGFATDDAELRDLLADIGLDDPPVDTDRCI